MDDPSIPDSHGDITAWPINYPRSHRWYLVDSFWATELMPNEEHTSNTDASRTSWLVAAACSLQLTTYIAAASSWGVFYIFKYFCCTFHYFHHDFNYIESYFASFISVWRSVWGYTWRLRWQRQNKDLDGHMRLRSSTDHWGILSLNPNYTLMGSVQALSTS